MLSQEQFEQLRTFSMKFLSDDPEAMELIKKSGLTESQLKVISVLVTYSIRAYDAMKSTSEIPLDNLK